jgi:uncharacterized protein (TIGR00730 family)
MYVTVYAGSAAGHLPEYGQLAAQFGRDLAEAGAGIVYGGGRVGLMGAVADAALAAGGTVIGVIPEALHGAELAHPGVTELHVVPDMHSRKQLMAELGDCFVALPGSVGTLEEVFDVWSQLVLGLHGKPVMLVNHRGYWDLLRGLVDHVTASGFLRPQERLSLRTIRCAADVLTVLDTWAPPPPRWAPSAGGPLAA